MDEDSKELSHFEKQKLPAELLFDPIENRAAVHLANHTLLAPLASKKLRAFVKNTQLLNVAGISRSIAQTKIGIRCPTGQP